ncbi:hypothetical protein SAMN00120144_3105 [Hymenobacter roseosalivarius DSM 11622]|uniref:Uncharacterized protein n=1 Tax=Hymenobacter roseosalivarius DSM 11622 TaxID=645990 RepID=A0A1W1UDV8_9BACT|nr:hypothetical protein [Hymenobacter roseosalivarius]SMB79278.1 hypothetical protein SAMN00120144_3105 [Hymenobacter roseosalivarius DSM 11622]
MKMALFVALALILLGVLSGLAWRRIKGKARSIDLVAKSNHKSVWSSHYGPATILPKREPVTTVPPPAAGSPLSKLMPAEDLRVQEEQAKAAARADAAPGAEPEQQQEQAAKQPNEPEDVTRKEAPTLPLRSSRHAPGAKVNVLDMLGTDKAAATGRKPAIADATPVAVAAPSAAAPTDDAVPPTLYANPLTEATRTRNDEANRQAAVALKQRNRAALRTGTDGQKAALAALITEGAAPG